MNKEESLALFAQGLDAWNEWAARMLEERKALEAAGTWTAGRVVFAWNDATRTWRAAAKADFSEHQFKETTVVFSGFAFPGDAGFSEATFSGDALFSKATFSGDAEFSGATFSGNAGFSGATFSGDAEFSGATFSGDVGFSGATFSGDAEFSGATFSGDVGFSEATFSGDALFSKAMFSGDALFSKATFSGDAWFGEATFSGDAWFGGATFPGDALFGGATFPGDAWFSKATFSGDAEFSGATFSGDAWFGEATFSGNAEFLQAVFKGFTVFDGTRFEFAADFRAIEGKSAFSLAGATFLAVPDFIQAHFAEAPRFDDSSIEPRRFWPSTLADVKNHFKGDRDLSARWRALKRLAVQGHDHMYELEFFKNELKTRRWSTDLPWHAVFWFGLFYGWLSGFGRSVVRPLFWWIASALAFAPLYLGAHFDLTGKPFSVLGWSIDRFVLQPFGAAVAPPLHCLAGAGDPWRAALGISARKALLFFGLDSSDKLTLNYACLFGVETQKPVHSGQLPASFYLDVPNSVIVFGIVQHIISAVLLFLLLLAIRNHFRIK